MAYFLDPAATGTSLNVAGAIQVDSVNVIGAAGDLKMNNLDGADFDTGANGYAIFGGGTWSCGIVCGNHGLACSASFSLTGWSVACTTASGSFTYCWCV